MGFPALYNGPFANDDRALDITVNSANEIFVAGYSQTGREVLRTTRLSSNSM